MIYNSDVYHNSSPYDMQVFVCTLVTRFAMHLRSLVLTIFQYLVLGFSPILCPWIGVTNIAIGKAISI